MKKRNRRKPKIADRKLRGEWAEMVFMARATELGIPVSKPWGESRGYDLVVGRPGRFAAVQVKSTTSTLEPGWICNVRAGHKPYPPGSFDFLAAYVVLEDAWYIIPEEEVRGMENITLHTGSSWAKYEEYREAWYLLGAGDGPRPGYIDSIQGCAEEFSAELQLLAPRADTKVPRFARDDNYAGNLFGSLLRRLFLHSV
jgi:hypothetical protein